MLSAIAEAITEAEHAFASLDTEKEVAQALRNAFVKKVSGTLVPKA